MTQSIYLSRAAKNIIVPNVKPGDNVVILGSYDVDKEVYEAMAAAAYAEGCDVTVAYMSPRLAYGSPPPEPIEEMIAKADVAFTAPSTSIAHATCGVTCINNGGKFLSIPPPTGPGNGIAFLKGLEIYDEKRLREIREKTIRWSKEYSGKKTVRIRSDLGTDLTVSIEGRRWAPMQSIAEEDSFNFASFPPSEIHIACVEDSGEGVIVCDSSISGIPYDPGHPIKLFFKEGWLVDVQGGPAAKKLNAILDQVDDNSRKLSEVGIGTNWFHKPTGFMTDDKKVAGGCHVAIGMNVSSAFCGGDPNGKNIADVHIDFNMIPQKPILELDGETLVKDGRLVLLDKE